MAKKLISSLLTLAFFLSMTTITPILSASALALTPPLTGNFDDLSRGEKKNLHLPDEYPLITDSDGDVPLLSISLTEQDMKGEFLAQVSMTNNPGIAGFTLVLNFEKTKITPVSISKGEALIVGGITSNIQQVDDYSEFDYVTANWVNASNLMGNGVIFTVKFKVKPQQSGSTELNLTYEPGNISNEDLDDIYFETRGASIELTEVAEHIIIATPNLSENGSSVSGSVDYNIYSNSDEQREALLILGVYDADGRTVYLSSKDISLSGGDNEGAFNGIIAHNVAADEYTVKIFCWDSFDSMEPIILPWNKTFE